MLTYRILIWCGVIEEAKMPAERLTFITERAFMRTLDDLVSDQRNDISIVVEFLINDLVAARSPAAFGNRSLWSTLLADPNREMG